MPNFGFQGRRGSRLVGFAVNALLRANMAYFLAQVFRQPNDPRFKGKALPVRDLVIVGTLSLLFPALYLRRRWATYPVWLDNLYLSIFWLDMAGNALDLYDRHQHFDLIPHAHGNGAAAVVLMETCNLSPLAAMGAANTIHILLEAQEYYTDVLFGTHNVRGVWDSIGDLTAGVAGGALYVGLAWRLGRKQPSG